ncbi:histidine phosphatase superfamily [Yarrowia lipolytica]|uniref:YALI0F22421p n=2 Tax=Yarrowia lipolytica TaxID=4952 RepID=Q6C0R4_YARLI|nr:YALI0F22421p [Yarrowia lipolytica CLIB122]QNP99755.1 Transcription factor tau 55 kDa subunit [Yarrowia lipolytica]RDW28329.1 histidine phosphatase superfamily [Yarrowia lipolytica]RDW35877.1 histidine phosphatase superfamily [Yarrowia lipolytica]RDW42338.1 histidine phosphatase superfamily [Yarrowia lipolytica]RDW49413.1 histidine phosphatase superfamily [Yarrowia lipolytica]|eukprot:XP_505748.2 YALI0F22421p [Yarrowia lipolytica CLIB122]
MVKTIYITRHGFRANWLTDQPIPPSPTGIESDPALAEKGVVQAKELGEYLKDIKPPIQRIYASPFYRCIETATPTADHLDLAIYPEGGCGEWFKRERSSHPKPASNAVLKGFFPRVDKNYNSLVVAGDDGEDEAELHERTKRFLNVLIEKLNKEEPEIETILIVSHAAPRIALGRALVGDNSLDIRTGVCSLDTFEVDKEGGLCGEWKLKSSGQVDYLSEGEVMHWGFDVPFDPGSEEDIKARKAAAEASAAAAAEGESDTVSVFIPLNVPPMSRKAGASSKVSSNAPVQISGLTEDRPFVKIGDSAYEGQWTELVGSEMYFNGATGEYVGKSRDRIMLKPMRLHHKQDEVMLEPKKRAHILDQVHAINEERAKQAGETTSGAPVDSVDSVDLEVAAAAVTAASIQDPDTAASLDVTMEDV